MRVCVSVHVCLCESVCVWVCLSLFFSSWICVMSRSASILIFFTISRFSDTCEMGKGKLMGWFEKRERWSLREPGLVYGSQMRGSQSEETRRSWNILFQNQIQSVLSWIPGEGEQIKYHHRGQCALPEEGVMFNATLPQMFAVAAIGCLEEERCLWTLKAMQFLL